ncbi:MAG: hypothetical protein KKG93_13445 [Bacteroidetes bacterium]|nr:hypothetical protein [Bacteroidota bacterium]
MEKIISKLAEIGEELIFNRNFYLHYYPPSRYVIKGNEISNAINLRHNENPSIKVLRWFDDFWLYIEININQVNIELENWDKERRVDYLKFLDGKFIKIDNNYLSVFFTLSVFQGATEDNYKTQLFRAEWDNYLDATDKHPQPHWHIYPNKYSTQTHKDFEDFIELLKSDIDFNKIVNNEGPKIGEIIELNKFHFAMNGQWSNNNTDVHNISIESDLTNWFAGILNHIKKELEYLKVK